MDAEHKARIKELEARAPRTPPKEHESQVAKLQGYATTIETRMKETEIAR